MQAKNHKVLLPQLIRFVVAFFLKDVFIYLKLIAARRRGEMGDGERVNE